MTANNLRSLLARRLRELMETTPDLDTQVKVAKRSGMAQSSVGRILAGSVSATIDNIEALARAFGIPAASLIGGEPGAAELEELSPGELETIAAFVRFTIEQHRKNDPDGLSFHRTSEGVGGQTAALDRAARRTISGTTLNLETNEEPGRRSPSREPRRRRSRHA